jgi:hypothetical protein
LVSILNTGKRKFIKMALGLLFGGVEFAASAIWWGAKSVYGVASYISTSRSQQSLLLRLEGIERRLDMLLDEQNSIQKDAEFIDDTIEKTVNNSSPEILFNENYDPPTLYTNSVIVVDEDDTDIINNITII